MRKLLALLVLAVAVLGVLPMSAAAKPQDKLLAPAQYFPAETPLYAAFRTDDGYFETLDGLLAKVGKQIPGGLPPSVSVKTLLNQMSASIEPGGTFKTVFRSWLGDSLAVGLAGSMETAMSGRNPPVLLAFSVTNKAAAQKFVTGALLKNYPKDYFDAKTDGDFNLWLPKADQTYANLAVALGKDMLFIGTSAAVLPVKPLEKNLLTSAKFMGTVSLLPSDGYHVLAYIDSPAINRGSLSMMRQFQSRNAAQPAMQALEELLNAVIEATGPQALGFTVLQGRALTMDAAQMLGDKTKLEKLGFSLDYRSKPVNLGFAANIPADAPLVMHGTGLGTATLNGFKNFRALGDFVQQRGILKALALRDGATEAEAHLANTYFNLSHFLTFGELAFSGMTGLNLEKDVLSWMDGDFASYLRVLPAKNPLGVAPDMATLVEVTNPDAARNVVTKLDEALTLYRFPHKTENGIISLPLLRDLIAAGMNQKSVDMPEIDLLIGTSDKVFAMGTRPGVEFSLNPRGATLADDPTYKAAQAFFLPKTETVAYLNLKPLYPTFEALAAQGGERGKRDVQQVIALLNILESGSVTAMQTDQGMVARFVLTLAQ